MTTSSRENDWAVWMRAAMTGDAGAYRQFLASLAPHVRAVARSRCRSLGAPEGEVEDIVQEVLLTIHLKRGTWDRARPIGPWVAAITRNKLIDIRGSGTSPCHRGLGQPAGRRSDPRAFHARRRHASRAPEAATEGNRPIHIAQWQQHPRDSRPAPDDRGCRSRHAASCAESVGRFLSE